MSTVASINLLYLRIFQVTMILIFQKPKINLIIEQLVNNVVPTSAGSV